MTTLGGRYRLGEEIATGGVGRVLLAEDLLLHRTVAVKVLRPDVASSAVALERFRREARAAAALSHPNIAAVYDFGDDGGMHYLVMEYVAGETLAERLWRGPLPTAEALSVATSIAEALGHAHHRGVVHRDVKPANVILGADGSVRVTDFGIARIRDEPAVTKRGHVMGTAFYMAPEQARGEEAGSAADLYGFGALLFEVLTGRPPYDDPDPTVVVSRHLHSPVPLVRAESVPDSVVRLVASLLAKDPSARPGNASAVLRVLRAAVSETKEVTREIGAHTQVLQSAPRTAARRHRRRIVVLVVVAVVCLSLVVAGYMLASAIFTVSAGARLAALPNLRPLGRPIPPPPPRSWKDLLA